MAQKKALHGALDDNLKHPNAAIQSQAAVALSAFCRAYIKKASPEALTRTTIKHLVVSYWMTHPGLPHVTCTDQATSSHDNSTSDESKSDTHAHRQHARSDTCGMGYLSARMYLSSDMPLHGKYCLRPCHHWCYRNESASHTLLDGLGRLDLGAKLCRGFHFHAQNTASI